MTNENMEELPQPSPEEEQKSNQEVALEVIAGRWGRGLVRKRRLQDAGYDVSEISTEMIKIFNNE